MSGENPLLLFSFYIARILRYWRSTPYHSFMNTL